MCWNAAQYCRVLSKDTRQDENQFLVPVMELRWTGRATPALLRTTSCTSAVSRSSLPCADSAPLSQESTGKQRKDALPRKDCEEKGWERSSPSQDISVPWLYNF